ncbi:MAG: septum formation initiator family protein [Alphaproteobacteria bacterium]
MVVLDQIKRQAVKLTGTALCALVFAYFAYGTVQGDRGLLAYYSMSLELERAETTYRELRETRLALEQRVSLLRLDSLDLDMLEERARLLLDYVRPGDFIVLLPGADDSLPR